MTEVIQWLTYDDYKLWKSRLSPVETIVEPQFSKSWRTEYFTVEIGQLQLTLKTRIPKDAEPLKNKRENGRGKA